MSNQYDIALTVSLRSFWNTRQGVCFSSEANWFSPGSLSESNWPIAGLTCVGRGVKAPEITGARPETGRSIPGQAEALRKGGGGPNRC